MLAQKDSRLQELEQENYNLRYKLDAMFNKFSRGIDQPSMPKIEKSGKFTVKQMMEQIVDSKTVDFVEELRKGDEKNRELQTRLCESVKTTETLNGDLLMMREVIDKRDKEIGRLGSLYESDQHLDRITQKYEHEKLQKKVEQLQKQLDFLNAENNKLTST